MLSTSLPRPARRERGVPVVEEMARIITRAKQDRGAATERDLEQAGFTTAEIATHREAAIAIARRSDKDRH